MKPKDGELDNGTLDSAASSDVLQNALQNDDSSNEPEGTALDALEGVVKLADEEGATSEGGSDDNGGTQPNTGDDNDGQPGGTEGGTDGAGAEGGQAPAGQAPEGQQPGEQQLTDADLELSEDEKKNLSQGAQGRFQKLASGYKEVNEKYETLQQQHAEIVENTLNPVRKMFQESQLAPEEIGELFEYGKAIKTGDYAAAGKILLRQVREYQLASGQTLGEADPLEEFPDLRDQVSKMELPQDRALEIARARRTQQQQQAQQEQQQQQQQTQQQQHQQVQGLMQKVGAWSNDMRGKDVQWPQIEEKLVAKIPDLVKTTRPELLMEKLEIEADKIRLELNKAPAPTPTPRSAQPLTSGASGGGTARQPKSGAEAAMMALGMST